MDKLPAVIIDFLTVDELLSFLVKLGKAFPRGQEEYNMRVVGVKDKEWFYTKLQMMSGAYENSDPN